MQFPPGFDVSSFIALFDSLCLPFVAIGVVMLSGYVVLSILRKSL